MLNFEPQIIIDGGAYVGFSSIYFALKYPKAKIFAVEPEEGNFRLLSSQTSSISNIIPINKGLWNTRSFLKVIDNNLGN
jgi:FkbM family methyltransferase